MDISNELSTPCKSCATELHGAYCSACGQKVITQRITVRYIFGELVNIVTNIDRGFLYTVKMMFIAPGAMIRYYLDGQTRRYYPPLRFLILLVTISVAINLGLGVFDQQQSEIQSMVATPENEQIAAKQQEMNQEIKKYLNVIPLLMIPLLALFSFLFFRKKPWNYAEHLVLHAFTQGQLVIIGLPIIILSTLLHGESSVYILLGVMGIGILYGAYVFQRFFQVGALQAFIKYFFTYAFSYFLLIIAMSIIMIIYLLASGEFS